MDSKTWIWVGLGALVLVWFLSRGGGSGVTQLSTGDSSRGDTDRARYEFAAQGLSTLGEVLASQDQSASVTQQAYYSFLGQRAQSVAQERASYYGLQEAQAGYDAQLRAEESRSAAMIATAHSQAEAQKVAAREAARGKRGFHISIPVIGDFGINF